MRISGFLIGGILGATAALYFTKGNRAMMANMNWDKALDKVGQAAKTAKEMWNIATTVPNGNTNLNQTASKSTPSQADSASNIKTVNQILAKDAALKQQVDGILQENGATMPAQ